MLGRLARFCYRRRWTVVISWIIGVFVLSSLGWMAIGPDFRTDFTLPDSETKEVFDFLEDRSPTDAGFTSQIVFATNADGGVRDPEVEAAMTTMLDRVAEMDGIRVTSPYTPEGAFQFSPEGNIAFAQVDMEDASLEELQEQAREIQNLGDEVDVEGLRIEYGGDAFYEFQMPASELLGILAAVVILLISFGSVLAMGLPIATALAGLFSGLALVALVSNLQSMPDFTPAMAAMIALGVGIDYALFIVTRHREGLHLGLAPDDAIAASLDSAGRAVLFAGSTVIISLLGLFVAGLDFVNGIALASICGVLLMMLASITLLPALVSFTGDHLEITTWRGILSLLVPVLLAIPAVIFEIWSLLLAGLVVSIVVIVASIFVPALRHPIPVRHSTNTKGSFWYRWSRTVQRRPWPAFLVGLVVLLALAIPLFSIRLGFGDAGNYPDDVTTRRAYDLLAEGFGPGFNGPLLVLVTDPDGLDQQAVTSFAESLGEADGVAFALPPRPLGDDAAIVTIFPEGAPQDLETSELVYHLRDEVIPASGMDAKVGGFPAINVDFSDFLGDRLPLIVALVLILSFLLLMVVFRSLLVPLKAVIMNLLSIGAAYGVVVAIFQWGWGAGLVGLDKSGPVEAWVPMMLFAIVFGLSMDYEVFLLSRIKEEYDRTGDNATAVADGLAKTAKVITAAALIMVCVFASFALGDDRQLKLFGLGLAVAVFLDATIVRMILVPSTMELLGERNWWLPAWLKRILPEVHIEGPREDTDADDADREPVGVGTP